MNTTRLPLRRATAAIVAAGLVSLGLATFPAQATPDASSTRIAGDDRYDTAAKVALARNPSGATTVLLASGVSFPDALAGAPLAGKVNAPVLLTERDRLPAATSAALDQLKPTTVVILGGTRVVSEAVAAALAPRSVRRIAGDDRFDTAARIATDVGSADVASLAGKKTAFISTGGGFADALAAAPLAAAGAGDTGVHPVLLVGSDVPAVTESALKALSIAQVVILGGTGVVSPSVETKLESITGNPAIRLGGADRYETATLVAAEGIKSFGFTDVEVLLASGVAFPDALAGGPLGQQRNATLVLTGPTQLPATVQDFLSDRSARVKTVTALGGTGAVPDGVLGEAVAAARTEPAARKNETIKVTPSTRATQANGTNRTYTVTGVTTPVDIVLVNCSGVSVDSAGNTTFADTDNNGIADGTAKDQNSGASSADVAKTDSRITSVNGTPATNNEATNKDFFDSASSASGSVTFVVSGPGLVSNASSCVVPVVFIDTNGNNALNVGTAAEAFGTGGSTTFTPNPASAGAFGAYDVESVNKPAQRFTACPITGQSGQAEAPNKAQCASFSYDDNDTYTGSATTFAEFVQKLNVGDDVSGTYTLDSTKASTFNLVDEGGGSDGTTPPPAGTGGPIIANAVKGAGANALGPSLAAGDVHTLTFDKAVTSASVSGGSYTVASGTISAYPIYCGGIHADGATGTCSLSTDRLTLTVTINSVTGPAPTYPMMINATTFNGDTGIAVDVGNSTDRTIAFPD